MEINKITIDNLDNDVSVKDFNFINDNITALHSYKVEKPKNTVRTKSDIINSSVNNNNNLSVEDPDDSNDTIFDKDLLKKMVIRWIKLDDNIKECNKQSKDFKDEKGQIEEKILLFMNKSETNEIQVKDGKLEKKRGEKKEPINEEYIKKCLVKTFDDVEMVDKLTKIILENRDITESYKLSRKVAKNPNQKAKSKPKN